MLVWYWFATEENQGAVMMTGADVAKELGMSADTLGRTVKVLRKARLLLEAGAWPYDVLPVHTAPGVHRDRLRAP